MVSSWDRRIGDVPAASDMNSSSSSGWIRNYKFGRAARATNVGNQYGPRHSSETAPIPAPGLHRRDGEGGGESLPFCHSISVLSFRPCAKTEGEGSAVPGALCVLRRLSESAGMAYDFASRQSRIPFAIRRKREIWFAFLRSKTETGARKAQDHTGADFRLDQDRNPHAASAGRGQIQPVARRHLQQGLCPRLFPLPRPRRRPTHRRLSASLWRRPSRLHG